MKRLLPDALASFRRTYAHQPVVIALLEHIAALDAEIVGLHEEWKQIRHEAGITISRLKAELEAEQEKLKAQLKAKP
jgi:hypothetical protein